MISREIITLLVFATIYIVIRLLETYILPFIPSFFIKEISSLYRLGPVLVPILFGMVYYKEKKTDDNILYERMMSWTKI